MLRELVRPASDGRATPPALDRGIRDMPALAREPSADDYKAVMSRWCTGVTVVTARDTERAHGMVASSFTGVSIDPMTILFCADRRTRTHAVVKAAGAFAVNVLAADQDQTFRVFTGQQGNPDDRFADECTAVAITGAPILTNSLAWMDCRVVEEYAGGNSHTIFVGRVVAAGAAEDTDRAPLLYFQRQVRTLATPDA